MNVLSLFDGIACAKVALDNVGIKYDRYFASEVDKYAIKIAKKNHPDIIHLGDVTQVKGSDLPKIDLIIAGSPCFVKGTKVITETEYKSIENVTVNDRVLTHTNTFQKVLRTGNTFDKTVLVKAQGIEPTETTANHPYYARLRIKVDSGRIFSKPEWVKARSLTKDHFIGIPIIKKESNPRSLSKEDCWLLGRYLADGHYRKSKRKNRKDSYQYQVIFSIGSSKVDEFKSRITTRHFSCYPHTQSTFRCVFSSKQLVELIEDLKLGKGAINKQIPVELLLLPKNLLQSFLDGYMSGDGCFTNGKYKATSISKNLIKTLNLAIGKVHQVNSSFEYVKRKPKTTIKGRIVNQNDTYTTEFRNEIKKQSQAFVEDNIIWLPVRSITETNMEKQVFNLEVAKDNSYTANNAIVHNCQGFSFAGMQLNFDDPRSKLFFHVPRLIKECQPKHFLLENVIMKQEYQDVISKYLGVSPVQINSALVSAQQRKRLYWTNIGNIPQPENKHIYLKDIIESGIVDRDKSYCIDANYYKGGNLQNYIIKKRRQLVFSQMASTEILNNKPERIGHFGKGRQSQRIYSINGKSVTLSALGGGHGAKTGLYFIDLPDGDYVVRKLTPVECERLQTLKDGYTEGISNTQRYKCLGNGFTVDVIAHILSFIKVWD